MTRSRVLLAALVLASLGWGSSTTATKYALTGIDPVLLLVVELASATIVLWLVLLVRGYRGPSSWRRVVALGLLEPALAYLLETIGLRRASAAHAAVITGLESTIVVVLAWLLLHERIQLSVRAAVLLALAGLAVLEGSSALAGAEAGDLLILAGVVSAALYTIVARTMPEHEDAVAETAHQFGIALLFTLPVLLVHGHGVVHSHPGPWLAAVGIGVVGYGASFLLYNWAIAQVSAGISAVVLNLTPVFGLATALVFLDETLSERSTIGAGLIAASVLVFAVIEARSGMPALAAGECPAGSVG